jgi:hypothetical protein
VSAQAEFVHTPYKVLKSRTQFRGCPMMTEDEELIRISNKIRAARKSLYALIDEFVDYRISNGDYQPSEREQRIADMRRFCEVWIKDGVPMEH